MNAKKLGLDTTKVAVIRIVNVCMAEKAIRIIKTNILIQKQ